MTNSEQLHLTQQRRNYRTDFQNAMREIQWAEDAAAKCARKGDTYSATTYELRAMDLREQWGVEA